MIKSIVREFRWSPEQINKLYLDDNDYHGLEFWYNFVCELDKKYKK